MKRILSTVIALIFLALSLLPAQVASAINISPDEYDAISEGLAHAPVSDISECSLEQGTQKTPGLVYIIGDQTIGNPDMKSKIEEAFSSSIWSVEINTEGRRRFRDTNTSGTLTDEVKDKILEAKHIVVALGGYERDFPASEDPEEYYKSAIREEIRQLANTLTLLRGTDASLYFVNVGSNADGTGKNGAALSGNEFRPETPQRFSDINLDLVNFSNIFNFEVIDWYRYVFGLDADPTAIDPTLEDTKGFLANDKYTLSSEGQAAWVENLSQRVTGSSNVTEETGELDNSSSNTPVSGGVLDGKYQLPASKGGVGLEGDVGPDGKLVSKNSAGHDIGDAVAFPQHAATSQDHRDYYITMRWRYAGWKWNGTTSTSRAPEDVAWYADKPRLVLVTNPGTGKSIITAILESGPAPWVGTAAGSSIKNNPPDYWGDGFRVDTPAEYDGRVGGLTQKGMEALGAEQWMFGGPNSEHSQGAGSELLFAWAPDQNAKPGPTSLSVGSVGCIGGNTVSLDGLTFPLQDITKKVLAQGSENDKRERLVWRHDCLEDPGGKGKCHHNYNAADLHVPPGWPVIAMKEGVLIAARRAEDSSGGRIQIRGSDGILYYYSHLDPGSIPKKFDGSGEIKVAAGELLGVVGASKYAADSAPHVHVDMLPETEARRPNCKGEACSGYPFLDIQSILVRLYERMPDE